MEHRNCNICQLQYIWS